MIEKIYGMADFAAAGILLFGGLQAPAMLLYICALVLGLKGTMSFVPVPIYMPSVLMCGTDIVAAALLIFSGFGLIKAIIILILFFKSIPGLVFMLFGK